MDEGEVFGAVAETMLTITLGGEAINSSVRVADIAKDNIYIFKKNDGYVKGAPPVDINEDIKSITRRLQYVNDERPIDVKEELRVNITFTVKEVSKTITSTIFYG